MLKLLNSVQYTQIRRNYYRARITRVHHWTVGRRVRDLRLFDVAKSRVLEWGKNLIVKSIGRFMAFAVVKNSHVCACEITEMCSIYCRSSRRGIVFSRGRCWRWLQNSRDFFERVQNARVRRALQSKRVKLQYNIKTIKAIVV